MKNYLNLINRKLKTNLSNDDFKYYPVCGKRNDVTKSGDEKYGEWKCIWEVIQANYSPKNIFDVEIKEEYVYEDDYEHSLFGETEYYGRYYKYPIIRIKTPKTKRTKVVIDGQFYF